jgi:3-deoxy-D-manno-octulosonate 8-phosphate phosphatase (KDO 8-P phosphatase)
MVKLLLTDCDGVLTDGGVYYTSAGEVAKRFFIRDGMGVERLRKIANVETGIVSGELSESIRQRAAKLKIEELHLGAKKKLELVTELAKRRGLSLEQIAYIGDDVNDLDVIRAVGLSACPADAFIEVRNAVTMVLSARGGHGAFREFAEVIIAAASRTN